MAILEGKAVVVTGSGRGIGEAYAKAFARLGALVVTNDIVPGLAEEVAAAITAEGGTAIAHTGDFCRWGGAGALIQRCVDSYGRIDGLVNNGGIFRMGRIDEGAEESIADLRALLEVNVVGTYNCTAHAVRHMKAAGRGSIVNVTSGSQMGIAAMGAYGATKGAVASLTYTWAAELAGSGIRVNAISPMAFTTQSNVATAYHAAHGREVKRAKEIAPEANAPVVAYLLSDRAEGVNGQVVRKEDTQLALMTHPAVLMPPITQDNWTAESVADAFDADLSHHLAPLGIVGIEVAGTGPVSAYWQGTQGTST